ncbi:MAG: GAF domain-containing protein, partial [Myxococcaceae bacterium]|nr:GAF domain-containing protein [Myxococcaceae bacterium]
LPGRPPDLEVTPEPPPAPAPTRTSSGISSARRKSLHAEPQQVVELEAPTKPIVGQIGRSRSRTQKEEIEDMLAEVFERVQGVFAQPSVDDALYYLLDLALEKIPAESGTIFDADAATGDLTFHAVRGPKAKELLGANLVIPAGTGIVGFCAVEGVSVALSDVQKDPRYFRGVAERVNYTPQSILCAPMMTHGRTFGCLQILNRHNGSKFNEVEIGLASYIAHQAALYLNSR